MIADYTKEFNRLEAKFLLKDQRSYFRARLIDYVKRNGMRSEERPDMYQDVLDAQKDAAENFGETFSDIAEILAFSNLLCMALSVCQYRLLERRMLIEYWRHCCWGADTEALKAWAGGGRAVIWGILYLATSYPPSRSQ